MNGKDISVLTTMTIMLGVVLIAYALIDAIFGRFGLFVLISIMSFIGVFSLVFSKHSNK